MLAKMNWRPCQNFQSMGDLHLFGSTNVVPVRMREHGLASYVILCLFVA